MSVPTASSMPVSLVEIAQPVRATAAGILHSLALEVVQPPLLNTTGTHGRCRWSPSGGGYPSKRNPKRERGYA
jgi:hypothetical protein